jgi:hypothetical protein
MKAVDERRVYAALRLRPRVSFLRATPSIPPAVCQEPDTCTAPAVHRGVPACHYEDRDCGRDVPANRQRGYAFPAEDPRTSGCPRPRRAGHRPVCRRCGGCRGGRGCGCRTVAVSSARGLSERSPGCRRGAEGAKDPRGVRTGCRALGVSVRARLESGARRPTAGNTDGSGLPNGCSCLRVALWVALPIQLGLATRGEHSP